MGNLNRFNLQELKQKYNIPVFFETGTARGDGVKYATQFDFQKIISVEIVQEQTKLLQEMFKSDSRVEIICNNSYDAIKQTVPGINENIMFWLDAHYPGADLKENSSERIFAYMEEKNDDIRMPLEKELMLIRDIRKGKDVILLDDLNLYVNHGGRINADGYFLKPRQKFSSETFFIDILKESHNFEWIGDTQGVLTPK